VGLGGLADAPYRESDLDRSDDRPRSNIYHPALIRYILFRTPARPARSPMKKVLALVLASAAAAAGLAAAERVPGQKPVLFLESAFQLVPGSWARYSVLDKARNETYTMSVAVLGRRSIDRKKHAWIEVAVREAGTLPVVTRFLAEETRQGPGPARSAIVQVQGRAPWTVPSAFLGPGPGGSRIAPILRGILTKIVSECAVCSRGRILQAWSVEARLEDGRFARAVVSQDLPPLGISELDSEDIHMSAEDWGRGAGSEIKGSPIPFWRWLADKVRLR
jgi:hypothetical protein